MHARRERPPKCGRRWWLVGGKVGPLDKNWVLKPEEGLENVYQILGSLGQSCVGIRRISVKGRLFTKRIANSNLLRRGMANAVDRSLIDDKLRKLNTRRKRRSYLIGMLFSYLSRYARGLVPASRFFLGIDIVRYDRLIVFSEFPLSFAMQGYRTDRKRWKF
ncbi:hypothetical protein EYR41_011086 [Orbilia oligospora]|uniref:Uncharacterized protein n=1 Tax=Orbilia oligospora TaxID=2813651 RepID=A0A8H2DME8_ORBOL|nr:hypothetical protein EYR41_011086 [Orbilia oligospora]